MKTSSQAVANYLLQKADKEDVSLSMFKLIKLVYLVYGFSLAFHKKSLFSDDAGLIEVWKEGPVIPALYHQLKQFGDAPIHNFSATLLDENHHIVVPELEDKALIRVCDYVWDNFKTYSVSDLFHLTHLKNSPWRRMTFGSGGATINDEAIQRYFKILSGLDPQKALMDKSIGGAIDNSNGDSNCESNNESLSDSFSESAHTDGIMQSAETNRVILGKSDFLARVSRANNLYNEYLSNLQKGDNIEARERYAQYTFILVCIYLSWVFIILLLDGFNFLGFYLSDTILGLLLGSSFVQIVGLFAVVMKYLYRVK